MTQLRARPERRFSAEEFTSRVEKARALMAEAKIDALLVTSEYNFRYLTGFVSQFWLSPTRPWYFILPLDDEPVAIISEVGVVCFKETSWVTRIETWPSPRPGDEGVSLVAAALSGLKARHGSIGAELGPESRLGIPAADFLAIQDHISPRTFVDGTRLINKLRMVKSPAEVERIRFVCQVVCDGFEAIPTLFASGDTEEELARKLHAQLIMHGLDKVPYMVGAAGPGGYRSAISSPAAKRIERGDVFIIDIGSTYDGYYCDFNRNWAFGFATDAAKKAYDIVWQATEAGINAARPGARACDLWRAQFDVLEPAGQANLGARMGHAIGQQLTEPPSNKPDDDTVLIPGMVMTIEPGLLYEDGLLMLHEENLVITESGCEPLTRRAPRELPIIPF